MYCFWIREAGFFRCGPAVKYNNDTHAFIIANQLSAHPPINQMSLIENISYKISAAFSASIKTSEGGMHMEIGCGPFMVSCSGDENVDGGQVADN